MKRSKLFCTLLAVLMLFSFSACGKGKTSDPNLLELGDYQLLFKDACIMTDAEDKDALVMTFDFTNNSEESTSYFWTIVETVTQGDEELEFTTVFIDDSLSGLSDSQFSEVAPGTTLEIQTSFTLKNTTDTVEAHFEPLLGGKDGTITIDPSTLSRESAEPAAAPAEPAAASAEATATQTASDAAGNLDWWNGDWYGWWTITGCWGAYEDLESAWWDVCGTIDIGADGTGTVTLWDEDYTKAEPMVSASVSLNSAGVGTHGTMMSEGGTFMDIALEHADWIVDPGLSDYTDMIHISGSYENGDDQFIYDMFLRPWGTSWDDAKAEDLPYYYHDWYLPLIQAGKPMPDIVGPTEMAS